MRGISLIAFPGFPSPTAVGRYSCSAGDVIPPMLSDRVRASRKPGITGYAVQERLPGSIYPEKPGFATERGCRQQFLNVRGKGSSERRTGWVRIAWGRVGEG